MNTLIFIIYYNTFFTCMNSILTYINYEDKIKRLILTTNTMSFFITCYISYISILYFFNYINLEKCVTIFSSIFISYLLSDCINMIKYKNFNTYGAWFHHILFLTIIILVPKFKVKDTVELIPYGMMMEMSTPFLCISDTFKNIPYLQKSYPTINKLSRIMFVITFFLCRILLCTYKFVPVIYTTIYTQVKLGLSLSLMLQYYWGYGIYKIIKKLLK